MSSTKRTIIPRVAPGNPGIDPLSQQPNILVNQVSVDYPVYTQRGLRGRRVMYCALSCKG